MIIFNTLLSFFKPPFSADFGYMCGGGNSTAKGYSVFTRCERVNLNSLGISAIYASLSVARQTTATGCNKSSGGKCVNTWGRTSLTTVTNTMDYFVNAVGGTSTSIGTMAASDAEACVGSNSVYYILMAGVVDNTSIRRTVYETPAIPNLLGISLTDGGMSGGSTNSTKINIFGQFYKGGSSSNSRTHIFGFETNSIVKTFHTLSQFTDRRMGVVNGNENTTFVFGGTDVAGGNSQTDFEHMGNHSGVLMRVWTNLSTNFFWRGGAASTQARTVFGIGSQADGSGIFTLRYTNHQTFGSYTVTSTLLTNGTNHGTGCDGGSN